MKQGKAGEGEHDRRTSVRWFGSMAVSRIAENRPRPHKGQGYQCDHARSGAREKRAAKSEHPDDHRSDCGTDGPRERPAGAKDADGAIGGVKVQWSKCRLTSAIDWEKAAAPIAIGMAAMTSRTAKSFVKPSIA